MADQIDRIVVVEIENTTAAGGSPLDPDELALVTEVLRVSNKLHYHLHVTMPSEGYW